MGEANTLIYTGAAQSVELRGPVSQILQIPWQATTRVQWAPDDRRVTPLEIRAAVLSWEDDTVDVFLAGLPVVRMRFNYGHGQATLYEPPAGSALNPVHSQLLLRAMPIPARGFLARITARELAVELRFSENNNARPFARVSISIQPVESMFLPTVGRADLTSSGVVGAASFPPWANEWRVHDRAGLPFDVGDRTVQLYDLQGHPFSVPAIPPDPGDMPELFDAADFAEWSPITIPMFAWRGPADLYATYR